MLVLACGVGDSLPKNPSDEPSAITEMKASALSQASALGRARVDSLVISPSSVSLRPGESVDPIALGRDEAGHVLQGVAVRWSALSAEGRELLTDETGRFLAEGPGTFVLKADEASGQAATMTITVSDNRAPRPRATNASPTSTSATQAPLQGGASALATATTQAGDPSYDPTIEDAMFRPINQRRTKVNEPLAPPPARARQASAAPHPTQVEELPVAGVGEFNFDVPLLASPGRGLDSALTLSYSAKVWTVSDTAAHYDVDGDWPAPGFTLSLGKVIASYNSTIFVDSSGTRHNRGGGRPLHRLREDRAPRATAWRAAPGHRADRRREEEDLRRQGVPEEIVVQL